MSYSLAIWNKPGTDEVRLYINGSHRKGVYFSGRAADGKLRWSSKTAETPSKFQTGDHYGKLRKDDVVAHEAAKAFGLNFGEDTFERALEIARLGLTVPVRDETEEV